jgi:hypothetical protein
MASETTVTEVLIQLMNGSMTLEPTNVVMAATDTAAEHTVGALRAELGLTGHVTVNDVIASDSTAIAADDRVVHVAGNKRGGK